MDNTRNESLQVTVQRLIATGGEGDYWDFKQEWHDDMGDLIKDIICFANTPHDKDCYIIFGVDDGCNVVGMKKTPKKQADIIDTITRRHFAGDVEPKISVESVEIQGKKLDVLIVEDVEKTPVYLKKPYGKMRSACIYTRVEDKNTPDGGNAEIWDIEKLWKKQLGLLKPPLEYIYDRLHERDEWREQPWVGEQSGVYYYNVYRPELMLNKIYGECDRDADEFYSYAVYNEDTSFHTLEIKWHGTVLTTYQLVVLDSGRYSTPVPEWEHLYCDRDGHEPTFVYKYFASDSDLYRLHLFFYNETNDEARSARNRFMEVILLYSSDDEKKEFEKYVKENYSTIESEISLSEKFSSVGTGSKLRTELYIKRLRTGFVLNRWLEKFRKEQ